MPPTEARGSGAPARWRRDEHDSTFAVLVRSLPVSSRIHWLAIAALIVAILGAGCLPRNAPAQAPPLDLVDQTGRVLRTEDARGHVLVLTFLYTHCTDTCPLYLYKIDRALSQLEAPDDVTVAVVTVDPERDTVAHLGRFAASWPANWHFLTGESADVARVWSRYGIYVAREEPAGGHTAGHQDYSVVHTAKLLVIDKNGLVATEVGGDWSYEKLATTIKPLLLGDEPIAATSRASPLVSFLQRCGEFATSQPLLYLSLVSLIMLPGIILPVYLLRTFVIAPKRPSS